MAQYSRPSPDNGRVVTDDDFEALTQSYALDGIIGVASDTPVVYGDSTGRQVKIRAAKQSMVRGYLWGSDPSADEIVPTTTNTSGNPRIDRLVLQLNRSTRNVRTFLKTGTPAASPVAPALTQNTGTSGVWEFPMARWQVASGYTTIAAADVVTEGWYRRGLSVTCTSTSRPFGGSTYPGMEIFETDTGLVYRSNSTNSRWLRDPVTLVETASTSLTSSTLVNAPNLQFNGEANATYWFDIELHYTALSTPKFDGALTFPAGVTVQLGRWVRDTSTNVVYTDAQNAISSNFRTSGGLAPNTFSTMKLSGTATYTGTAGVFRVRVAQTNTDGANPSFLLAGSWMNYRQIA